MTLRLVENSSETVSHHVCYFQGRRDQAHYLRNDFEAAGATVHYCPSYTLYDPRGLMKLFRVMRAEQFDVVHNHVILTHPIGRVVGKFAGVNNVISTHDGVLDKYRPHFRLFERLTRLLDDTTVAYSEGVMDILPKDWEVVHNGIDVSAFRSQVLETTSEETDGIRAKYGIERDDHLFLNVSRYVEQKSQKTAIRAFERVCREREDAHLVLVGYGPLESELRALNEELGVTDHVTVAGKVEQVEPYYAAADAFVLTYAPYIHDWGIVALEAMAAGLPIVATRTENMDTVVVEGENGYLADAGDLAEMAEAIERLCDTRVQREMGETSLKRVTNHFDISEMVAKYERLYTRHD